MTELNEKLEADLKFFDSAEGVRDDDEYDKVQLSDGEDDENNEKTNKSNCDEDEELSESDEDEDDEGESLGSKDSSSESDENNKRKLVDDDDEEEQQEGKKRRKVQPVKRPVDGDNISLCFIPMGKLDRDPLCLIGMTLVCVRTVPEQSFLNALKVKHGGEPSVGSTEEEKLFEKKYDFFEAQSAPSAPVPRHFCQHSKAEHFLFSLKGNWQETALAAVKSLQEGSLKPKRCFVYCVVKFDTAEQLLAYSCPFLCYPMQGKLTWSSPFSTNWQSATEWPNEPLDRENAPLNAALVTEAKLFRSTVKADPSKACSACHPLGTNALFEFRFEKLCAFGEKEGGFPVRHQLKISDAARVSAHTKFDSGALTLRKYQVTVMLQKTNFLAVYDETLPHQHGRSSTDRRTTMKTTCQGQVSRDRQTAAVLSHHLRKEAVISKAKSLVLFRHDPKFMTFKDGIYLLRQTSENSEKYKQLMAWIIPAMAPANFWRIVDIVGFRNAMRMAVDNLLDWFQNFMESSSPQISLDTFRFGVYNLSNIATFCDFVALQKDVAVEDVKLYSHLSDAIRQTIENVRSEQRFHSRPDANENTRKLCWPSDPSSTVAAVEVGLASGEKTTFVTRKNLMQQDVLISCALAFGFSKNIRMSRSDNRHTLRELLEDQVLDGNCCAIIVNTTEDKVYWDEKTRGLPTAKVFLYTGKQVEFGRMLRQKLVPLPNEEKWNVAFPRVDLFAYDVLALLLSFVTTVCELDDKFPNNMSFAAMKSAALLSVKSEYSKGCCSAGGALIIGGLAFQFAADQARCGNLLDDLYFSGLLDNSTKESYNVVQHLQEEASRFVTSGEKMINETVDNEYSLSSCFVSFSKHFMPQFTVKGFESIEHLNVATRNKRVLTLYPNTVSGDVNTLVKQKIDQSATDLLPILTRNEANFGCVAVVFDSVEDNHFFNLRREKKALSLFSYDYYGIDKQPNTELVDRLTEFHRNVKNYLRSGFSLAAMISLAQFDPKSIVVFGSKDKSIDARMSGYCEAPWFLTPPSKTQVGRPWYQNSEATELSALCWILASFWNK